MGRKLLGQILREHGKVTEEQIKEALERQSSCEKALGRILFDMGLVSEEDISLAWSEQLGTHTIDLSKIDIPDQLISQMPKELAERYNVIPVKLHGNVLILAMSDPVSDEVLKSISAIFGGAEVKPVVSSALGIAHAILKYY